jgi:hypothetical protein
MSAQYGAPALRRAPSTQLTRRAMAVAAATLCAPLVAASALAGIGAAGGGNQAEMGTLAGSQGLRGTTVGASTPAPAQAANPTPRVMKNQGAGTAEPVNNTGKSDPAPPTSNSTPRQPAPSTRAPAHKAPAPRATPPRIPVKPPAATPTPTVDPSGPGAPIPSSGSGAGSTSGSSSGSGSSTGTSGGGSANPDSRNGYSGSD